MPAKLYTTRLARVRLTHGWTLQEVADAIGIDTGSLSRLERGRQGASPETAARLADLYGRREITELEILYPERFGRFRRMSLQGLGDFVVVPVDGHPRVRSAAPWPTRKGKVMLEFPGAAAPLFAEVAELRVPPPAPEAAGQSRPGRAAAGART